MGVEAEQKDPFCSADFADFSNLLPNLAKTLPDSAKAAEQNERCPYLKSYLY